MELTVHDNHGVTVVMVSGEMDVGNSTQLGEELDRLLTGGTRKLVIDLGKVGFMNSSSLATLSATTSVPVATAEIFPWWPFNPGPSGLPREKRTQRSPSTVSERRGGSPVRCMDRSCLSARALDSASTYLWISRRKETGRG